MKAQTRRFFVFQGFVASVATVLLGRRSRDELLPSEASIEERDLFEVLIRTDFPQGQGRDDYKRARTSWSSPLLPSVNSEFLASGLLVGEHTTYDSAGVSIRLLFRNQAAWLSYSQEVTNRKLIDPVLRWEMGFKTNVYTRKVDQRLLALIQHDYKFHGNLA